MPKPCNCVCQQSGHTRKTPKLKSEKQIHKEWQELIKKYEKQP